MESWIKFIDEEKALAATHAAADEQDRVERQVSTQWRTDTVLRQRDRLPVVPRELPADEDYFDQTTDEDAAPSSPSVLNSNTTQPVPPRGRGARGARGRGTSRSTRSSRSEGGSTANNLVKIFAQMEENRLAAEERRDAAAAVAIERREAREAAAREREAAIREREVANSTAMMQQITALVQHVIHRPVGDYRQLAPSSNFSTSGGASDENNDFTSGPVTPQPHGRFG